ncbi:MAG: hypothetical protein HC866_14815 [Leptolyngbyaceae cyanobacterium RU_5_1]|nr:hypothetical protein [Leptolyngbyaceae cyanobacterium RU_5_1]
MVNVSQPDRLQHIAALPIDGIGLLRAELLAIAALDAQHPDIWLQQHREAELVERMAASIVQFAQAMSPRSVFYRSFDLRTHEFYSPKQDAPPNSVHSVLGVRGTLSYMLNPTLFKLELAAIAQVHQSGYPNVHLMLPFVRTVEEFRFCRQLVEQAGLKLNPHFQLWIMAEVPSVLLLLPDYVQAGVQGISIGTNDLTQLLLGVDRDQAQIAAAFEERHPAVKRAIAQLIQQAQDAGIPCSICGEAPVRYPELIDDLIRWGIHSISVAPEAVESTYGAIVRAERNLVLQSVRQQTQ